MGLFNDLRNKKIEKAQMDDYNNFRAVYSLSFDGTIAKLFRNDPIRAKQITKDVLAFSGNRKEFYTYDEYFRVLICFSKCYWCLEPYYRYYEYDLDKVIDRLQNEARVSKNVATIVAVLTFYISENENYHSLSFDEIQMLADQIRERTRRYDSASYDTKDMLAFEMFFQRVLPNNMKVKYNANPDKLHFILKTIFLLFDPRFRCLAPIFYEAAFNLYQQIIIMPGLNTNTISMLASSFLRKYRPESGDLTIKGPGSYNLASLLITFVKYSEIDDIRRCYSWEEVEEMRDNYDEPSKLEIDKFFRIFGNDNFVLLNLWKEKYSTRYPFINEGLDPDSNSMYIQLLHGLDEKIKAEHGPYMLEQIHYLEKHIDQDRLSVELDLQKKYAELSKGDN